MQEFLSSQPCIVTMSRWVQMQAKPSGCIASSPDRLTQGNEDNSRMCSRVSEKLQDYIVWLYYMYEVPYVDVDTY